MKLIVTALVSALLYSCAAAGQPPDDELLLIKASALTKVAAAVDSAIRYKDAPMGVEAELLRLATEHDPELLAPFQGLKLRVRRSGANSSVLVCSADETRGLIEDAGCTARSDEHLWRRQPSAECRFHLDLDAVCNAP